MRCHICRVTLEQDQQALIASISPALWTDIPATRRLNAPVGFAPGAVLTDATDPNAEEVRLVLYGDGYKLQTVTLYVVP